MSIHSFKDLEVWKLACRLAIRLYRDLNGCKDFGLKDQMTRAAVSIASSIAEGAERASNADFNRFLNIAKGSAAELRTQVYIAARIGVLTPDQQSTHIADLKKISAMLHALAKSLQISPQPLLPPKTERRKPKTAPLTAPNPNTENRKPKT